MLEVENNKFYKVIKTRVKNTRLARKMFPNHEVVSPESINIIERKEISAFTYQTNIIVQNMIKSFGKAYSINALGSK